MSVRTCNFPKADGIPCGSPSLHGKRLRYFHHRDEQRRQYAAALIGKADPSLAPACPA